MVILIHSFFFNTFPKWVKRPHKGPECVIEIVGVDLDIKANRRLDFFTKPDLMVECTHSRWERKTQIEGNTFNPRFAWKAKIPHKKNKGFTFTVYDCNVLERNEVVGRVFVSPDEVEQMQSEIDDGSRILSLGHGIGQMKVRISPTPEDLEQTYTDSTDGIIS